MQAVLKKIAQYYPFTADRFVCLGGFCQWYESFSTMLLEGYASKTTLQKKWVDKLPYFVYYRQWYSYLYFEKHLEKNEQVTQMLEKMKSYLAAEKTII